jgi:hypothetical protein
VQRESQPDPMTGKWREVPTLPSDLRLSPTSIAEIKVHIADLDRLCGPTPEDDPDVEAEMLALLAKMMMALPSVRQDELATEASGEAFLMAVEDLPVWAVKAGLRRWYRGDVGCDQGGNPYNTHWRPAPADLRAISMVELWRVRSRIEELKNLATAEERIEYSAEHCADMRKRLAEMWKPGPHRADLSPRGEKSCSA